MMTSRPSLLSLLLLSMLVSMPVTAKKKTFTEDTSVVVVEIPVNVIRDGEPLRGLRAEDFEIYDGRKKVDLVSFEEIDLAKIDLSKPVPDEVPIAARRHFLLLFDLSYSMPSAILRARRAAREVVLDDLHESDLVAVATYASNAGARLVLSFTPDRRQVELAMETLGAPNLLDLHPDPLGILLSDFDVDNSSGSLPASGGGRADFDTLMEEHLRSIYQARSADLRREQTQRVSSMTRSLADLAGLMAGVKGRKHVVYLSEGFDTSLLLGTTDQAAINRNNAASSHGEIWDINSNERFGDSGAVNDLENMIESFRRADCAVQSVDIGGLRAGHNMQARPAGKDGLVAISRGTGGGFFENFNDLGDALGGILDRTSVTYLLSFQPRNLKADGKYHKLKIKLAGNQSGVELQHRPGYYAPRPYSEQSQAERNLAKGSQILSGERGGAISIAAVATAFQVEGEKAYVPVFVEVDGPSVMGKVRQGGLGIEVYAYALADDGTFTDYFSRQVGLDLAKAAASLEQGGAKFFGHLDLDPGRYSIRILVRNIATGDSGSENLQIEVPDWGAGMPSLSTPVFPEPMGKWLMIREDEAQQQERVVPYPFMHSAGPFFPSARRQIRAQEPASVWVAGYDLPPDADIRGRVLSEFGGEPLQDLRSFERRVDPEGGKEVLTAEIPQGLAAGKYRLEFAVTDPLTGSEASSWVPFEVSN